jgi:hypothetical protein
VTCDHHQTHQLRPFTKAQKGVADYSDFDKVCPSSIALGTPGGSKSCIIPGE